MAARQPGGAPAAHLGDSEEGATVEPWVRKRVRHALGHPRGPHAWGVPGGTLALVLPRERVLAHSHAARVRCSRGARGVCTRTRRRGHNTPAAHFNTWDIVHCVRSMLRAMLPGERFSRLSLATHSLSTALPQHTCAPSAHMRCVLPRALGPMALRSRATESGVPGAHVGLLSYPPSSTSSLYPGGHLHLYLSPDSATHSPTPHGLGFLSHALEPGGP